MRKAAIKKGTKRVAFDFIGNKEKAVAIIGANYLENEKHVAKEIVKRHKNVKSVLKKLAERRGKFRLYPTKLILGNKNTEVIHKEYGYFLKLDPRKVYFSPREGEERQRVAEMVKPGEKILVMFSGVSGTAIAISKKQPSCEITCVDINPQATKYANENVKLNKLKNIKNICADVRKWKSRERFDRIAMPLAEGAIDYLDVAFVHANKGAIIHLYGLSSSPDLKDFEETIKQICKDYNFKFKILRKEKVLPYAPRVLKVRIDLKII